MALSRNRRDRTVDYWPGFVDALSTLLLTFMFVINMFNAVTALPAMAVVIEQVFPRKKRPRVVAPSH